MAPIETVDNKIVELYSKPFTHTFEPINYRQFGGSWGNLKERFGIILQKKRKITEPSSTNTNTNTEKKAAESTSATPTLLDVPPGKRVIKTLSKKKHQKGSGAHKRVVSKIDQVLGDDSY